MKIITTNKKERTLPKSYIRIVFIDNGVGRFVEKDGATELHIVSGKLSKITPRRFITLIRKIVQEAKRHKVKKLVVSLEKKEFPKLKMYTEQWFYSTVAENLLLADYQFDIYKSKKPKRILSEVLISGNFSKKAKDGLKRGRIVAESANLARDLANTPGGDMTPSLLAKMAKKAVSGTKIRVKVLNESQIKKLKMGGLIGVGKGAKDKPKFIILEYYGTKKSEKPIVFVGKGITFDTGGLQVKPGMAMYEMHMDMSGGASVIGALRAVAKLGLKKNVIGLIPSAENAVSDEAIRPGDVITTMSGKTVDVLHTDAEGRLVLADGLHYARKYNPRLVIDIATLTGAAVVALGRHAHAIMTPNRKLEDKFRDLGEESGDYVAPLPLWEEYKPYMKGVHGDISNMATVDSKYGGAINAGTFLSFFTKKMRWVHIDMAPRMTSVDSDLLSKGATGEPVRLLVKIVEEM